METQAINEHRGRMEKSDYIPHGNVLVSRRSRVDCTTQSPYYRTKKSMVWTSQSKAQSEEGKRKKLKYGGPKDFNNNVWKGELSQYHETSNGDKSGGNFTTQKRVCRFWMSDNCVKGENCRFLHAWFHGHGLNMLKGLGGHKKAIKGIAFPSSSEKLYSASRDGTARVWNCQTGQCDKVITLGAEIGCLVNEGPWLFIGMPNVVKAWNIQTNTALDLEGPVGQVNALVVGNDMLFAGAHDGVITVWKGNTETDPFQVAAFLKGHTGPMTCLCAGDTRLFSGSIDSTIRVWDFKTLKPIMTLKGHTDVVTSLLCWDHFLISCSLDRTIKVWAATAHGNIEVTYTHEKETGALALAGMHDGDVIPILFCAHKDKTVTLYELPTFRERAVLFTKHEIRTIQIGRGGLFFIGEESGKVNVWNMEGSKNEP